MFFNEKNPILEIRCEEHLQWKSGSFEIPPRSFSVLAFRIQGSARLTAKGKEYFVAPNEILYLPQNIAYTAEYSDTEMIAIHFVAAQKATPQVISFESGERFYALFQQVLAEWQSKESGYELQTISTTYRILAELVRSQAEAVLPAHFLNAVSFINSGYKDPSLSIEAICAQAGISQTAFRTLFKKHYQKPPSAYIAHLRLDYARNLIAGGASIESAALASGFTDPKYFARTVKKHFGCTPRELKTYGK